MMNRAFILLVLLGLGRVWGMVSVSPGEDVAAAAAGHAAVTLLPGTHTLPDTLMVSRDLTLFFANGAVLASAAPSLIRHMGGLLIIEGTGKPGVLASLAGPGQRGFLTAERKSLIDLNHAASADAPPALVVRNMELRGYNGIDGYWQREGKLGIGAVEISNCSFRCEEKAIGFIVPSLASIRVENCQFDGGDECLMVNCPVPGGAIVRGNVMRNFGRRGMMLGKAGQIADNCTAHLPSAVVHDNQLLGGGQRATLDDSYTQGILIYGHNVSVQGNIVRDVNRGQEVPGEIGRVMVGADGQVISGIRIDTEAQKHRRLAGAAIYLKANRALVQGNVCTNSGWRSVIEIKTGGKEHFVSVVNNVVDGRALSRDESFGFECNAGRSLWAGNLVYDMPNEAFVVRSGFENTFMNNLIVNARIGFALSGNAPGQGELISGNRFINVEHPVALDKNLEPASGLDLQLPSPVRIGADEDLPDPAQEWQGRQIVRGDKLYMGVQGGDGSHRWMELGGKLLPRRRYQETGPELALNPDQSATAELGVPELDDPLHRGWQIAMRSSNEKLIDPAAGHVSYDRENFRTGTQSLKVAYQGVSGNWSLSQKLMLPAGRRYRATAWVKGEEPLNLRLMVLDADGKGYQKRAVDMQDWQLLSVDFVTPSRSGAVQLRVWSSKTNAGKSAWLDSVSVRELLEEELDEEGKVVVKPVEVWEAVGPELAYNPDQSSDAELPVASLNKAEHRGWMLSMVPQDKSKTGPEFREVRYNTDDFQSGARSLSLAFKGDEGNLLLSQGLPLKAGRRYRASAVLKSNVPRQVVLGVKTADQKNHSAVPGAEPGWQTQQVDFTVPEQPGASSIRIWASRLPDGEAILIDAISVRELQRVEPAAVPAASPAAAE